ncbi:aquaporin AQPAe.a [Fopius arisanus]|uniref:AQP protein n=1 Tax=Fopius arisanus TaxID=64838 RepID=A0A0C9Q2R0_9HYME|nr:PREDICTED: aquaporin AQPAe.a-like [Fopius arisanus]
MEQNNISIVTSNGITENVNGKVKTTISLPSAARLSNAAKIKAPWLKDLFEEESSVWDTLKCGLAEFIGTGLLVFLGCMGCVGSLGGNPPEPLQISFVFGLAVMLIIQSIGHISGAHINPSITVGSVVLGKKSLKVASVYLFAQCLGAIAGYGMLKVITPQRLLHAGDPVKIDSFCVTNLNENISVIQGLLGEIMATAVLMFMTCAIWDARNERNTDSIAIKFGLTVTVLCLAVAPYTGCSMNPARSLGPAIWNNSWSHHWIYWFGPLGGALIASVLYRSIFSLRPEGSERPREQKAEI